MKKLYGFMGLFGFVLTLCGAGAEEASFAECAIVSCLGTLILCLSVLLCKIHTIRMRKLRRKYMIMKKKCVKVSSVPCECVRHTPHPGILAIISSDGSPTQNAKQTAVC